MLQILRSQSLSQDDIRRFAIRFVSESALPAKFDLVLELL